MGAIACFGSFVHLERIAGNDLQAAGIFSLKLGQAGMHRRSRSTAMTWAPVSSSALVSPPGPGPTS